MATAPSISALRMQPVAARNREIRLLFEAEKAFVLAASTLIPRIGVPEIKYRLAEHIWEAVQHARLLLERGRELPGFGSGESIRPALWFPFDEAIRPAGEVDDDDGREGLAAVYRVLKPALLEGYRAYLANTEHLGDWPTTKLVEEFIRDEERHAAEMSRWVDSLSRGAHEQALADLLGRRGGLLTDTDASADGFTRRAAGPYRHPSICRRDPYPICGTAFGENPAENTVVPTWFADPATDSRMIRMMIYVWLFNEMDAVDYLSTVFHELPGIGIEVLHDLARHLWDEARHSQFGYRALPRLGVDLNRLEQQVSLYVSLVKFNPAERYALMTQQFEAGSFEMKAHIMDRVRELGDFEADTLLAFDRNDEQHHVRYGTRHLPALLEYCGMNGVEIREWLPGLVERFVAVVNADTERIGHTLPATGRVTALELLDLAGVARPA